MGMAPSLEIKRMAATVVVVAMAALDPSVAASEAVGVTDILRVTMLMAATGEPEEMAGVTSLHLHWRHRNKNGILSLIGRAS